MEEAALLTGALPEQLIAKAITANFEVFIQVSADLDVYNVGDSETDYYPRRGRRRIQSLAGQWACRVPEAVFLGISTSSLIEIGKSKRVKQDIFSYAGVIDEHGSVKTVYPSHVESVPSQSSYLVNYAKYLREFAAYPAGIEDIYAQDSIKRPEKLQFSLDEVIFPRLVLECLMQADKPTAEPQKSEVIYLLDFPDATEPYVKDTKLKIFYDVFNRIWGATGGKNLLLQDSKVVLEILKKEFKLKPYMADFGVQVVFNNVICKVDEATDKLHIEAKMMEDLIAGAADLWKPKPGEGKKTLRSRDVTQWFIEKEWPSSTAENAARAIRPPYVRNGRPPNDSNLNIA